MKYTPPPPTSDLLLSVRQFFSWKRVFNRFKLHHENYNFLLPPLPPFSSSHSVSRRAPPTLHLHNYSRRHAGVSDGCCCRKKFTFSLNVFVFKKPIAKQHSFASLSRIFLFLKLSCPSAIHFSKKCIKIDGPRPSRAQ